MKKINKNFIIYIIILLVLSLAFIPMLINFIFFPKEINIIAGNTHKIDFNIPAIATIVPEDESVLNVNNNNISKDTNVNLKDPLYISSDKEGYHNMKISLMGIPVTNIKLSVLPEMMLIPGGNSVGVRINTDGVMVLGFAPVKGADGKNYEPTNSLLKAGDMILKINNEKIDSKETLVQCVEKNNTLNIEIRRKEEILNVNITPIKGEDGKNKIGAWVRDSTQGIGTLTYINPTTNSFGALGHGIVDVDTREIMKVKDGKIMKSEISNVKKGEKGSPGELVGDIKNKQSLGNIYKNSFVGIYGEITDKALNKNFKPLPIGTKDEVLVGDAKILCNINGSEILEYDIKIQGINKYNNDDSKSMVIEITDERLLNSTNGIVQGMSGSPIIQNDKIIGAVTHVFVNDPKKGYGIFIENMLKEDYSLNADN